MPESSLVGRLLVATPVIADPNFERTVVLVLAHGEEGILGVVLNRPSTTDAADLVPGWGERAVPPPLMFLGGPVAPSAVIGLHRGGAVDLNVAPEDTDDPPDAVRLFAGSAGWGADQLASELAEQAWWVVDADADDAFTDDPGSLWRRVVARQRGTVAWFAHFPANLRAN